MGCVSVIGVGCVGVGCIVGLIVSIMTALVSLVLMVAHRSQSFFVRDLERDFFRRTTLFTAIGDALTLTTALDACAVVSTKSINSAVLATKYSAHPNKTTRHSLISFCCAFHSDMAGSSKIDWRRNNVAATAFIARAYNTVLVIGSGSMWGYIKILEFWKRIFCAKHV